MQARLLRWWIYSVVQLQCLPGRLESDSEEVCPAIPTNHSEVCFLLLVSSHQSVSTWSLPMANYKFPHYNTHSFKYLTILLLLIVLLNIKYCLHQIEINACYFCLMFNVLFYCYGYID